MHTVCMDSHIDSPEDTALLVDLLIEAGGAEVEATDIDGHTALHFCCLNGLTEAAKVLVCTLDHICAYLSSELDIH